MTRRASVSTEISARPLRPVLVNCRSNCCAFAASPISRKARCAKCDSNNSACRRLRPWLLLRDNPNPKASFLVSRNCCSIPIRRAYSLTSAAALSVSSGEALSSHGSRLQAAILRF